MRTLLVLSGGGLPGIDIHAGIGLALSEQGIVPDEIHGTSAGAVYGALYASRDFSGIAAADIIRHLTDAHVRDPRSFWQLRFGLINSMMSGRKIRRVLDHYLPDTFEELPCTLYTYAVERGSGVLVGFNQGNLKEAVRASASIHGIFPPAEIRLPSHSLNYSDGGTKSNVPVPDDWQNFDRVFVCIATQPVNYRGRGLLFHTLLSVHELMEGHVDRAMRKVQGSTKVTFIRPPIGKDSSTLHWNHDLIEDAYDYTRDMLRRELL